MNDIEYDPKFPSTCFTDHPWQNFLGSQNVMETDDWGNVKFFVVQSPLPSNLFHPAEWVK